MRSVRMRRKMRKMRRRMRMMRQMRRRVRTSPRERPSPSSRAWQAPRRAGALRQ